jgi:hypothetical protein
VLNDITGLSGQRILDAILAGNRDPVALAQLCHARIRSNRDTVAKALEGDYRGEHIFTLRQSLESLRYYQRLVAEGRWSETAPRGRTQGLVRQATTWDAEALR